MTYHPPKRVRTAKIKELSVADFMPMIEAMAYKMHLASQFDKEDCRQACLAEFYRLRQYYGIDHPRFPILLKQSLFTRRVDMVKLAIRQRKAMNAAKALADDAVEAQMDLGFMLVEFQQTAKTLSKEAQDILHMLVNVPEELKMYTLQAFTKFLHKKKGWTPNSIQRLYKEIKEAFQ